MNTVNEQAIRRLVGDIARAVTSGRLDVLLNLLDGAIRAFPPGAPVLHGRSEILPAVERWFLSWKADLQVVCDEITAEPGWGFCSGTFGLRSVHVGGACTHYEDGKFLAVLRKGKDNSWRLYRLCHNSNLPDTD